MLLKLVENGTVLSCAVVTAKSIFTVRLVTKSTCPTSSQGVAARRCSAQPKDAKPLVPIPTCPQFFLWSGLSRQPRLEVSPTCPQLLLAADCAATAPLGHSSALVPHSVFPQFFLTSGLLRAAKLQPHSLMPQFFLCVVAATTAP